MLSSILAGLDALGGAAAIEAAGRPLLVTPADLPAIEPSTIQKLIDALERSDAALAVPAYRGKRGHPLAIAARVAREISRSRPGGRPAPAPRSPSRCSSSRSTIRRWSADVDTPAEYEALLAKPDSPPRPR